MKLAEATWTDVAALDRDTVVLLATGAVEQHGPHLPLGTDAFLATAVAEAVESRLSAEVLLVPTLAYGCSAHHLGFAGTLSLGFDAYVGALASIVESLGAHGFHRFFVLNGHGGNDAPNEVALRTLKAGHPAWTLGGAGYVDLVPAEVYAATLTGPVRRVVHACEAETSLMLHVHPDRVRMNAARDDGLSASPAVPGVVWHFDEQTERGVWGYPTLATAEKGRRLFEAAVEGAVVALRALREGVVLLGP